MGFEFGNVQHLGAKITMFTFLAVIAFVVVFDFLVGLMEYYLSSSHLYNKMIQLIYKELMLMGLVSFTIIMAEALQQNSESENETYHEWVEGIEFSHILIFFLTFFFVFHAFFLMRTSVVTAREYRQVFATKTPSLIKAMEGLTATQQSIFNLQYFPLSPLRDKVEFQLLHFLFGETYVLSEGFNFSSYLSGCFDRYALKTINRSMFTWFVLMILCVLNYGRVMAGYGFMHCDDPVFGESAGRRYLNDLTLLADDHATPSHDDPGGHGGAEPHEDADPHASGGHEGPVSCAEMNVKFFIFMALLLVIYAGVLVFVSRMYKIRLINRIGFTGPQDYLKFLKFAEDNKTFHQERMTSAELKKEIEDVMDADEYISEEEEEFREIGEFLKMVVNTFWDTMSDAFLYTKVFIVSLINPDRVKVESTVLSRKEEEIQPRHHRSSTVTTAGALSKDTSSKTKPSFVSLSTQSSQAGGHLNTNSVAPAPSPAAAAAARTPAPPAKRNTMLAVVSHLRAGNKQNAPRADGDVEAQHLTGGRRGSSLLRGKESNPFMDMLANVKEEPDSPTVQRLRSTSDDHVQSAPLGDHVAPFSASNTPVVTGRKSRSTMIQHKGAGGTIEKFQLDKTASQQGMGGRDSHNSPSKESSSNSAENSPAAARAQGFAASLQAAADRAKVSAASKAEPTHPQEKPKQQQQSWLTSCWYTMTCRGNKVAAAEGKEHPIGHHKETPEEKNEFIDMYLFGKPIYFFRAVELCIMFNCLYLAFWTTNFIVITTKMEESQIWKIIGQILMAIPFAIVVPCIGYIAEICSLLTAISELNLEVVHEVLVETEDVTILVNELRVKMLQRISSVETADMKKLDIIHGLFSEIDKDGSGCIDQTEFRLLLKALKLTYSDERFKRLYRAVDADGDNKISRDEIDLLLDPAICDALMARHNGYYSDDEVEEFGGHGHGKVDKAESFKRSQSKSNNLMGKIKNERSTSKMSLANMAAPSSTGLVSSIKESAFSDDDEDDDDEAKPTGEEAV